MRAWSDAPAHRAYDVAIVGAGAMGASAAWHLLSDPGFSGRLLLVERDPTFAQAASSLSNSCIRQQFSTPVNIRVSQAGVRFLRAFRERMGDPLCPEIRLEGFGYLYLAGHPAQAEALRRAHAVQAAEGVGTQLLSRDELALRVPGIVTDDILLASHNPGDEGYFDGGTMVAWFRRKAADLGAECVAGEVVAVELGPRGVCALRLADGARVNVGTVVNAAGTRAGRVAAMAGRRLPIEARRRCTVVFAAEPPGSGPLPLVIDPSGVHVRQDGANYLCGYAPADDRAVAEDDFAWPEPFEEAAWPALAARIPTFERLRVLTSWIGHYEFNAFDQNALIGWDPEIGGLLHLCGFSGHGLQQAPAMGQGVADLVVAGHHRALDLRALAPDRVLSGVPLREESVI